MICTVCGKEMKIAYNQEKDMLVASCETCKYDMPYRKPTENLDKNLKAYNLGQNVGGIICRVASALCGAVALFGAFLPFVKASFLGFTKEASFFELTEDAKIFVSVVAVGLVLSAFAIYIIPIIAGIFDVFLLYIDTSDYWKMIANESIGQFASKGVGYYCMYIGAIGLSVFAIIGLIITISNKIKNRGIVK